MLRYLGAALVAVIGASAFGWVSFLVLEQKCSLEQPKPKIETHLQKDGANQNNEGSHTAEKAPEANEANAQRPSGTFQLQVTDSNKIEGSYYTQASDGEKGDWVNKFICEAKLGELSLAILTFALVMFTGLLWASTDSLGKITREAHEANIATQRAIILPGNFLVGRFLNADGGAAAYEFRIEWINQGNTRANRATFHINWETFLEEVGVPTNYPFEDRGELDNFGTYLGPKATTYSAPLVISVAEIHAVQARQLRLIFYGWVRYREVFDTNQERITRFCTELIQVNGDPYSPDDPNVRWFFRQFPRYSCIDEECTQQDQA
jgi:hypothetical protein